MMRMRVAAISMLAAISLWPCHAGQRGEIVIRCPASIRVEEKETSKPVGWNVVSDNSPFNLKSMDVASDQGIRIHEDDYTALRNRRMRHVWILNYISRTGLPEKVFARCGYRNTSLVLLQPLPTGAKECRVESYLSGDIDKDTAMICR